MNLIQHKPPCCYKYSLKHSCVVLGTLNALISLVLLVIMSYLTIIFAIFKNGFNDNDPGNGIYPLYLLSLVVIAILLVKLTLDVIFVYGVIKKHMTIIRVYFFVSLAIFILITGFVIYESVVNGYVGASFVELMFYSLDITTIFLSYFYSEELKSLVRDEV
ncbi:uncharacterized protein LOC116770670 [Danaus plexippus]|uniref:uncharacterized protein LOC116770670 n=1 Tax=Danaus plexippus TaxID=13037 RepID=UPI002AAF2CB6|nr:uncharacterized protein LOC116770670 [Danaus plexippus]